MVNGGLRTSAGAVDYAVDIGRIEQPIRINERQSRYAVLTLDLPVETRASPGVTGSPDLLDLDPDRVLVAVHAHLDHALGVAGVSPLRQSALRERLKYQASPLAIVLRRASSFMCATIRTSPVAASVATQVTRPDASNLGWNANPSSRS